jgi:starch synthase
LLALIGRLADQKGWDLVIEVMRRWIPGTDAQWAILGTGEPQYHDALAQLSREFPRHVAAKLEFSDALAHRIEAGADMFLMPSLYEPCGLNQLYSLKYGTVPVVRATGGLVDTVTGTTPETITDQTATGFSFEPYDANELDRTLRQACEVYWNNPGLWNQLVATGMRQDWSWSNSARQYVELYQQVQKRKFEERERLLAAR